MNDFENNTSENDSSQNCVINVNVDGSCDEAKEETSTRYELRDRSSLIPICRYPNYFMVMSVVANETVRRNLETAFLYVELKEDIYMLQPKGYKDGSQRVSKLLKGLDGSKLRSKPPESGIINL